MLRHHATVVCRVGNLLGPSGPCGLIEVHGRRHHAGLEEYLGITPANLPLLLRAEGLRPDQIITGCCGVFARQQGQNGVLVAVIAGLPGDSHCGPIAGPEPGGINDAMLDADRELIADIVATAR